MYAIGIFIGLQKLLAVNIKWYQYSWFGSPSKAYSYALAYTQSRLDGVSQVNIPEDGFIYI